MSGLLDTAPRGLPTVDGGALTTRAEELRTEANDFFSLHGKSADAPRMDETDSQYQRRLLQSAQRFSPEWARVDLRVQPDSMLPLAWRQVVADGIRQFKEPVGPLRKQTISDESGRRTYKFYGDPEGCWAPFKPSTMQFVSAWNPDGLGRGADAPGAIKPVRALMSDGTTREL